MAFPGEQVTRSSRMSIELAAETPEPLVVNTPRCRAEPSLVVVETHPVQYRAPVYRRLQEHHGVPVTVIYGSDFSVAGYYDCEFQRDFAWDCDLLWEYRSSFVSRVCDG